MCVWFILSGSGGLTRSYDSATNGGGLLTCDNLAIQESGVMNVDEARFFG